MDPFGTNTDGQNVFNIGPGKAAIQETTEYLLNVKSIGDKARKKLLKSALISLPDLKIELCVRKWKRLLMNPNVTLKSWDGKLVAAEMVRDVFCTILSLSIDHKIYMADVLAHPLTPIPLSLCDSDGSIQKTPKVTLMKTLQSWITTVPPVQEYRP